MATLAVPQPGHNKEHEDEPEARADRDDHQRYCDRRQPGCDQAARSEAHDEPAREDGTHEVTDEVTRADHTHLAV